MEGGRGGGLEGGCWLFPCHATAGGTYRDCVGRGAVFLRVKIFFVQCGGKWGQHF